MFYLQMKREPIDVEKLLKKVKLSFQVNLPQKI